MSLTLHHFQKEFRHLRWRWLAWLVVLMLDLAVDAEWIAPLSAELKTTFWTGIPSILVWLGAVGLALDFSREDARADDNSFIALRPLPECCFWGSRVLVFALLLLLPLAVQEGIYLLASGRPAADVLDGMSGKAFLAGAVLLWLLPMPLLGAGWSRFGLAGAALLTGVLVKTACETWLGQKNIFIFAAYDGNSLAQAAWISAASVAVLAWWQRGRGWSLLKKGAALAALATGCYALLWTSWLRPWSWHPQHPELARALEARYPVLPEPAKVMLTPRIDLTGEKKLHPIVTLPPMETPKSWIPGWRVSALESNTARPGKPIWQPDGVFRFHSWTLTSQNALAPHLNLPAGTLSRMSSVESAHVLNLDLWGLPEDPQAPLDLRAGMQADWFFPTDPQSVHLKVGARIRTPEFDLEILEVRSHESAYGLPARGTLTLTLRIAARQSISVGSFSPVHIFLHDSKGTLLWQNHDGGGMASRASNRGWVRWIARHSFSDVLTQGTGLTEQNLGRLEVMAFRLNYAGRSRHRLELQDLRLGDNFLDTKGYLPASNPRVASHPREAFHSEFERIKKPAADAPRAEVARYLAHVLTLAETMRGRGKLGLDKNPLHPGDDLAIADKLAPLILAHPDVITTGLRRPYGRPRDENTLLRDMMEAALLTFAPDRLNRRDNGLWCVLEGDENETRLPLDALISGRLPWNDHVPLVEQALRERSLEPVFELHRRWLELERRVYSDDEILASLKSDPSPAWLLRLKGRGQAAEQGRALVRQAFANVVPPTTYLSDSHKALTEAALFAGSEAALHQTLCYIQLWQDHTGRDQRVLLSLLSVLSRALGGKPVTSETYRPFMESIRERRAADYWYDPVSMTWSLKPQP